MSPSADDNHIVERMQLVRNRLGPDAKAARQSIHDMTDWRQMVRSAPWKSIGAAVAVGYLLVPKRQYQRTVKPDRLDNLTDKQLVVKPDEDDDAKHTIAGTIMGAVGVGLARVATNYAMNRLGQNSSSRQTK